jgi:mono/diheme cytochrome c family protein
MLRFACTLLLLLTPAVALADAPTRASGDLAIQAREILRKHCSECHTGSPEPGHSKLNVMDYAQLTATDRSVPAVKPGGRSQLLELIKDGSMPPANRQGPTAAEVAVLEKWVAAQAPAYPAAFDERYTLGAVADDLANTKGKLVRYASFAHLVRDGEKLPDLVAEERKLREAFALAGPGAAAKIEAVDPAATVYRIELPKAGWGTRELFRRTDPAADGDIFALRPFDLVHLEYPLAARLAADDPLAKRLTPLLDSRKQMRPVPFVRGDWLSSAIARGGKLTPLGEDVRSLIALELAMDRDAPKHDGPPVPRLLGGEALVWPRASAGGRTPLPSLSAWYTGNVAPKPAPFTLSADLVSDGQLVKGVTVDQEFKLRVRSDRRVRLTVLVVQADGEVQEPPLRDGPIILPADTTRDLTPEDRPFSISGIITGGDSATEYFVVFASEAELPVMRLRSLHPERPVWRFLVSPAADTFDPGKVVRVVVPIPVTRMKK